MSISYLEHCQHQCSVLKIKIKYEEIWNNIGYLDGFCCFLHRFVFWDRQWEENLYSTKRQFFENVFLTIFYLIVVTELFNYIKYFRESELYGFCICFKPFSPHIFTWFRCFDIFQYRESAASQKPKTSWKFEHLK